MTFSPAQNPSAFVTGPLTAEGYLGSMKKTLALAMLLLAVAAPAASAATAPTTSISSASSIDSSWATLNGSVNPNGSSTSWYFEYGTSTNYSSKTPTQSAGSGTGTVNVAASVLRAQGSRTYHFRLVATSDGGTSRGARPDLLDRHAPAVATADASSIGSTSARFSGSVNPNGQSTRYYFELGTTTATASRRRCRSAGSGTRTIDVSDLGVGPRRRSGPTTSGSCDERRRNGRSAPTRRSRPLARRQSRRTPPRTSRRRQRR